MLISKFWVVRDLLFLNFLLGLAQFDVRTWTFYCDPVYLGIMSIIFV